jgi:hypothetical protein
MQRSTSRRFPVSGFHRIVTTPGMRQRPPIIAITRQNVVLRRHDRNSRRVWAYFCDPCRCSLERLDQRLGREWLGEIGEAPRLKRRCANGRGIVPRHVDDRRLMMMWSGIGLGAVIESFQNKGWHRSATLAVETAASHFSGNHLAAVWQVGEAPAFILMHAKFSIGLDGHKPHKHARPAVQRHDHRPAALGSGGHARKLRARVWRTATAASHR